jgi:hypothetical protein
MIHFSVSKQKRNIKITEKLLKLIDDRIPFLRDNPFLHDVDWPEVKKIINCDLYQKHITDLQCVLDDQITNPKVNPDLDYL